MPVAIVRQSFGPRRKRQKNIGGLQQLETLGQHPHYRVRPRIQRDRFSHRIRRAAETALPQAVTQQHHRGPAGRVFLRAKCSPHHRVDAQQRKQSRRRVTRIQPLRIARAGQRDRRAARPLHRLKRLALRPPVHIIFIGSGDRRVRRFFSDNHQPGWIVKTQRPQQNRIHHRENRRVRANPQRQSDHRDQREPRILPHHPRGISQIVQQSPHHPSPRRIAKPESPGQNCAKLDALYAKSTSSSTSPPRTFGVRYVRASRTTAKSSPTVTSTPLIAK